MQEDQSQSEGSLISLISSHLTSFHRKWVRCEATQFAVAATNQSRYNAIQYEHNRAAAPIKCSPVWKSPVNFVLQRDLYKYFVLIGRSHGKLDCFTEHSVYINTVGYLILETATKGPTEASDQRGLGRLHTPCITPHFSQPPLSAISRCARMLIQTFQNFINSFLVRRLHVPQIARKFTCNFWSYSVHKQNKHSLQIILGVVKTPPSTPVAEVIRLLQPGASTIPWQSVLMHL